MTYEEKLQALVEQVKKDVLQLRDKASKLVELMDDAEKNHGALIGGQTLRAVGELRLELAKWR